MKIKFGAEVKKVIKRSKRSKPFRSGTNRSFLKSSQSQIGESEDDFLSMIPTSHHLPGQFSSKKEDKNKKNMIPNSQANFRMNALAPNLLFWRLSDLSFLHNKFVTKSSKS